MDSLFFAYKKRPQQNCCGLFYFCILVSLCGVFALRFWHEQRPKVRFVFLKKLWWLGKLLPKNHR